MTERLASLEDKLCGTRLSGWRSVQLIQGSRAACVRTARRVAPTKAVWISNEHGLTAAGARGLLGQGFPAVVLDLEGGFRADLLGVVHGLVEGGGTLFILLGPWLEPWVGLQVWPHRTAGQRMIQRLQREVPPPIDVQGDPLQDQRALVERLLDRWLQPRSITVLTADRGRGKSATLGLALARSGGALTGPSKEAVAEVVRFAPNSAWAPAHLLTDQRIVVVDEAAMLSVPVLRRLVERNPDAHLVFATTVHGYEGTGRGFDLRFVPGLEHPYHERLEHPMRWRAGDPVERWVFDVLLLGAEADAVQPGTLKIRRVFQDELAADEALLRGVFGLLAQAHYRTTPSDLQRLLDAPNMSVHVALKGGAVVGATLVAAEGSLDAEQQARLQRGVRLRGHALPDTLWSHSGCLEASAMPIVRSVRIAVHPDCRRQGIASALVEDVHEQYPAALFGTLFGATPAVLRFRRSLGYRLVRIGTPRNARSGQPTAVMLRPTTPEAMAIVQQLQLELARDLPVLLRHLRSGMQPIELELAECIADGQPIAPPWTPAELTLRLQAYRRGRPFESVAPALYELDRLGLLKLSPEHASQMRGLIDGTGTWGASLQFWPTVRAAMRGLRAAILEAYQPDDASG